MKKKIILSNIVSFVVGLIICGGVVYASNLLASDVAYDNTQSGLTATNVQSALDELNTKSNTWINPSYIDFGTLATNTAKTVLASKNGVCIKRNNKASCFKVNNWSEEQNHIQQVFSDVGAYDSSTGLGCIVFSDSIGCDASDFTCSVYWNGRVYCNDRSGGSSCNVKADGSVSCT